MTGKDLARIIANMRVLAADIRTVCAALSRIHGNLGIKVEAFRTESNVLDNNAVELQDLLANTEVKALKEE